MTTKALVYVDRIQDKVIFGTDMLQNRPAVITMPNHGTIDEVALQHKHSLLHNTTGDKAAGAEIAFTFQTPATVDPRGRLIGQASYAATL